MNKSSQRTCRQHRWAALAVLVLLGTWTLPTPAEAAQGDVASQIERYQKHPDASSAWKLHEHFRKVGHLGKAMNWAEHALASPKLNPTIRRKVLNLRHSLRWKLRDAGFGMYKVLVKPVHAWLSIDGKKMYPRRNEYQLWLPVGSHALDLKAKDYADESRIIAASRGEVREMRVNMEMTRAPELRVEIQPINAEVWANRVFLGRASRRVFRLTPGPKVIEIRSPGYHRWVHTLSMRAGERHVVKQVLKRIKPVGLHVRIASDVERKLTPLELANRGGRGSRLGQAHTAGPARKRPTAMSRGGDADGEYVPPPRAKLPSPVQTIEAVDEDKNEPQQVKSKDEPDNPAVVDVVADSGGGSGNNVFKGWLWSGIGLTLIGGGVGAAMVGVSNARAANQTAIGYARYDEFYDPGAQLALVGYGTAALGGITLVVGSLYLYGNQGLSRSGKGWTMTTLGLLAGSVGGYLILDSITQAEAANALAAGNKNYTPNFDGAEQSHWTGVGAAGAGGLLALVGLYVAFTKGSRSADAGDAPDSLWQRVAFTPSVGRGQMGGVMHLRW